MPVNLPPQAQAVYEEYQEATKIDEKIRKLEEYLSLIPDHKGTENLVKRVKRKLAKLRVKKEKKRKKGAKSAQLFTVPKKLDVQLPLYGAPSAGKSRLFKMLTGGKPNVGKRTHIPHQGAFYSQGIGFQIVDLPPLFSTHVEETPHGRELMGIAKNADIIGLTIDLSQSISWQFETLKGAFSDGGIELSSKKPPLNFKELSRGGIRIFGMDYLPMEPQELKDLIDSAGISNCIFEAYGELNRNEIVNTISRDVFRKPTVVIGTKADVPGSKTGFKKLQERTEIPIVVTSAALGKGDENLATEIRKRLNLIRIWTDETSKRAVVLKSGATVEDAAEKIHSSFVEDLRFAKIIREDSKVKKKRVGKDYKLKDGDKVEFILK